MDMNAVFTAAKFSAIAEILLAGPLTSRDFNEVHLMSESDAVTILAYRLTQLAANNIHKNRKPKDP